jgi:uncharacterized protein YeaO (DUF488 family)
MDIQTKRVYEQPTPDDGERVLVERLWPRGVRKADLKFDAWLKDVGPSTELRKWFNHDPERWVEFRTKYWAELDDAPENWRLLSEAARRGRLTLLFSSHDEEHNNAVALQQYLEHKLGPKQTQTS